MARCVSVAGAVPGAFSFETAWMEGVVTGIARATVDSWAVELVARSVASGFAVAVIGPDDRDRFSGVGVRRKDKWTRGRIHTSVFAGNHSSDGRQVRRERVELQVETAPKSGQRIDLQLRQTREWSAEVASTPYLPDAEVVSTTRWRARLRIGSGGSSGFSQRSTVVVYGAPGERRRSVVGRWEAGVASGPLNARVAVSNYDFFLGQTGYVVRPGAGGYETVSILSRRGSDLSLRGGVDLRGNGTLQLYVGVPWRAPARFYVHLVLRG
jgi:hypothetical protein